MPKQFSLGVNSSAYIGYDFETALSHIASVGFRFVEPAAVYGALEHLHQQELTAAKAAWVASKLAEKNLHASSFAAHINLAAPDAAEFFLPRLRFAADIGAPVIVTGCGPKGGREQIMKTIDKLLPEAERLGVIIALETNADLLSTGVEGVQFVKHWNSPWLGVNYDAANVLRGTNGAADIQTDFAAVVHDLKHLHLKDIVRDGELWRFALPGDGVVDISQLLATLQTRQDPLAVILEMPYQYRLPALNGKIQTLPGLHSLADTDRELHAALELLKTNLKESE